MTSDLESFCEVFRPLTGNERPMKWQTRFFQRLASGEVPAALDLPTGLGKTSVMAIWLAARALARPDALKSIPRRLVYVVDRRAVVDQATEQAKKLRTALGGDAKHVAERLGLNGRKLPISTLRGAHVDNREWLDDPASIAIIVGTVDMIGSRLLFEGYGVSRKMRPYHAGLLGADTLIVLDEAHLVPPFADLLRAIESEASLWPDDPAPLPRPVVLPLSATQRERPANSGGREVFSLEDEDISHDDFAEQRINARKMLSLKPPVAKDWDGALAAAAWKLAAKDDDCARVAVFCNRRDKADDESSGPSVMRVLEQLQVLAKANRKAGVPAIDFACELLVGGRRVRERQNAADNLTRLGFAGNGERPAPPGGPTFLLATSAGEVGVDFDADHMVCDLAPWERMVQRLGRVNRRGGKGRQATVVVFDTSQTEKDDSRERPNNTLVLLQRIGEGGELSSAALNALRKQAGEAAINAASTPDPLRPALTRALVDAWSLTSLEQHTGRPDVAPWLRGWVEDDKPQTSVIWRAHLPVRTDANGKPVAPPKTEIEAFFEAAPPHESEKLETETWRVTNWLIERAKHLTTRSPLAPSNEANDDEAASGEPATDDARTADGEELAARTLKPANIVAFVLSSAGDYRNEYSLGDLKDDHDKAFKRDLEAALSGATLVVDARFAGLKDGMLDKDSDHLPEAADSDDTWSEKAGFRVRLSKQKGAQESEKQQEQERKVWRAEYRFIVRQNDDSGDAAEWLVVEHYKDRPQSEDGRSVRNEPQELGQHQSLAEQKAGDIASKIGISGPALDVLTLAARLHDEGKRAEKWQRAFRAKRDAVKYGLTGPLAKTTGFMPNLLGGYRHEFGSLAVFESGHPWAEALPDNIHQRLETLRTSSEWFDLLQHLVASHHGGARPVIATCGCEDAPPSALEDRAREVALRFARLQKRWGPWGLAWWEALLRSADQQASRDNDRGEGSGASRGEEK
ncbi:MAG TPA: type I-U CRISPR-associated helicase/endonuclease Cas3 [Micropepsaceae bacterium]|nr:type I-U CRISPR-associated helicase/endonuclease Cas3 [Micropepsaceae bacterium]